MLLCLFLDGEWSGVSRLLPQLRRAGYDVTYYEFDGPHFITPPLRAPLPDGLQAP